MMLAQTASPDAAPAASGRQATDVLDVLVVGGGQAGLATAYHLRSTGLRCQVLNATPGSATAGVNGMTR